MRASALETKPCTKGMEARSLSSRQNPEITATSNSKPMRFNMSSSSLRGKNGRHFIKVRDFTWIELLGARRIIRTEASGRNLGPNLPISDVDGVLGRSCNIGAGNYIAAGIGMVSLGDPDLPINFLGPESQVIAFDTTDDTASKILGIHHQGHELSVRIRHQQVRSWYGPVVFFTQLVN